MAYVCQRCSAEGEVWPGACPSCGATQHLTVRGRPQSLEGALLDGRYRVGAQLGQGGMGTVYQAVREDIGQQVAIKVLNPDLSSDPELVKRFLREARSYGAVSHPGAVALHDLGQTPDGQLFIAMELVNGVDLAKMLKAGPLAPAAAVDVALQLCEVLHVAHQKGVIHRDLKPENVMLAQGMRGFHVKVLDFGIARVIDQAQTQLTQTGAICGTPRYMSPEQARGLPVDARSDIYSLGLVLYETLAGTPAFLQPSVTDLLHAQVFNLVPHLTLLGLPPALDEAIQRACAKDREARFQSMDEFGKALAVLLPALHAIPAGNEATLPPGSVAKRPDGTAPPATPVSLRSSEPVYEAKEIVREVGKEVAVKPVAAPPTAPPTRPASSGPGLWTVLGVLAMLALLADAAYEVWSHAQTAEAPKQGVTRLPQSPTTGVKHTTLDDLKLPETTPEAEPAPAAEPEPAPKPAPTPLFPKTKAIVLRPLSEVMGTTGSAGTTGSDAAKAGGTTGRSGHSRLDELLRPIPKPSP